MLYVQTIALVVTSLGIVNHPSGERDSTKHNELRRVVNYTQKSNALSIFNGGYADHRLTAIRFGFRYSIIMFVDTDFDDYSMMAFCYGKLDLLRNGTLIYCFGSM